TAAGDAVQALFQQLPVTLPVMQAQDEPIALEGATLELAGMARRFLDVEFIAGQKGEVWVGLAWQMDGEPLLGDRMTVLQSGVADLGRAHAGPWRQLFRHPLGVAVSLTHPHP